MTNDGIIYNISIHALREEGDLHLLLTPVRWRVISIHALREEGDHAAALCNADAAAISIHALREEGDLRLQCGTDSA